MAFVQSNVQVVQCDVPDCEAFHYFLGQSEVGNAQWLIVSKLGDPQNQRYICPEHASLLKLGEQWTPSTAAFAQNARFQSLRALIDKGASFFRNLAKDKTLRDENEARLLEQQKAIIDGTAKELENK